MAAVVKPGKLWLYLVCFNIQVMKLIAYFGDLSLSWEYRIYSKKLISKLFVRHSSRDKRQNEGKKLNCFLIKLNEDDWMFEKGVKTRDQRIILKL